MKYDEKFDLKISILIEFLTINNRYPRTKEIYKGIRIKSFVNLLRNMDKYGKRLEDGSIVYKDDILTKVQIDKLNKVNFIWDEEKVIKPIKNENKDEIVKDIIKEINIKKEKEEKIWDDTFELLNIYLEENEMVPPKSDLYYKGVYLGKWYENIKTIFINGKHMADGSIKYKNEVLTKKQVEKVKTIKNTFNYSLDKRGYKWNFYFDLLCEYIEDFEEFPKGYDYYRGYFLATWCNEQRTIFNNGIRKEDGTITYQNQKLTPSEINKLNSINFDWIIDNRRYLTKKINKKADLEKRMRYIKIMLDRFLKDKEEIPSKEEFNCYYTKILSKKD